MLEFIFIFNLFLLLGLCYLSVAANLLTALVVVELLWGVLFAILVVTGVMVDSILLLGFTLFVLVVAGLELSIGLLLYYLM